MHRIPLTALQGAIYKRLAECQTVPVYDAMPDEENVLDVMPFITFGAFTCAPIEGTGGKFDRGYHTTLRVEVWSAYRGKREVQEIAGDVITLLSGPPLALSDGFMVAGQGVTFFEAFPQDWDGHQGVITFDAIVYDTKDI